MPAPTIADRRERFRALHESVCFLIPNPWDVGSAVLLENLGFPALASTSAGFAWTRAKADGAASRDEVIDHLADLVAHTTVPINADYENAYAHAPADVAASVVAAAKSGIAGLSVEDNTGDAANPLYGFDEAVARVKAAADALKGTGVLLTARCEAILLGRPDGMAEVMRRLPAFAEVGADVLYAPGLREPDQIAAVVKAVAPKPVNLLVGWPSPLSVTDIEALGVRRISVGGALARAAYGGMLSVARDIIGAGSFKGFAGIEPSAAINGVFKGQAPQA
ncbi:MAG: isocitrate lyase/phosphoenolpyruvate mutase family protein [Alphaproteobacteria bacterium]